MDKYKQNPNAFPTGTWEYDGQNNVLPYQTEGMTLRDYFAAKVLAALISLESSCGSKNDFASEAYGYADAMLKARK